DPGTSFAAPAMQGATPQSPASSGEVAGKYHHGPSLKAIMEKLGITDEQKTKIRALRVGFLDRTRKTRMDLRTIKDEKKTMLLSGKIDQQKLAQADDQVVKLVSDLLKEKLKLRRDRLALLTPEQIGRIADWQAEKAFRSKARRMHRWAMHRQGW
ncbi:MAG: Spy/CpxP family protein refolding chaperone, partial [Desulfomonilaceae bacterium]